MRLVFENGPHEGEVIEVEQLDGNHFDVIVAGDFGPWSWDGQAEVRPVSTHNHRYRNGGPLDDGTIVMYDPHPECDRCCQHEWQDVSTYDAQRAGMANAFRICSQCGARRNPPAHPEPPPGDEYVSPAELDDIWCAINEAHRQGRDPVAIRMAPEFAASITSQHAGADVVNSTLWGLPVEIDPAMGISWRLEDRQSIAYERRPFNLNYPPVDVTQ